MIVITKEDFVSAISAIEQDWRENRDSLSLHELYFLVLKMLGRKEDTAEVLDYYLELDENRHIDRPDLGETFSIDNPSDLYDYISIFMHPEEDSAYHLTNLLLKENIPGLPDNFDELYTYICKNPLEALDIIHTDYHGENIVKYDIALATLNEITKKDK